MTIIRRLYRCLSVFVTITTTQELRSQPSDRPVFRLVYYQSSGRSMSIRVPTPGHQKWTCCRSSNRVMLHGQCLTAHSYRNTLRCRTTQSHCDVQRSPLAPSHMEGLTTLDSISLTIVQDRVKPMGRNAPSILPTCVFAHYRSAHLYGRDSALARQNWLTFRPSIL